MPGNQLDFSSFAIDLSKFGGAKDQSEEIDETEEKQSVKTSHRYGHRHLSRKVTSEKALEDSLPWHFKEGDCYHCFSFGDVDSLTYFKMVLRQQPVKYLSLSTWCMAGEDVDDLRKWHRAGLLGRVDFYFGEIFQGSYAEIYENALDFSRECGGRVVIFRNHSKVMAVIGERFDCLIESSANVNTNPRSENTVLTVDRDLTRSYIELFNGINSFNKDSEGVPLYDCKELSKEDRRRD